MQYLDVRNLHFVSNGTMALQLALRALDITDGEVITTPFSYVATTSAILWERCMPVFVDIDPQTFCIDVDKIEASITDKTRAIMAVHVFGNPCDIETIDAIAKRHKLKVIYDSAHAFGTSYRGKSLLGYGDISIGSFHATKLFHTIEGGCVVARDKAVSEKVELMKRFGHNYSEHVTLGINAKASEFQAAMGLCNLKYIQEIIQGRKVVSALYDSLLENSDIQRLAIREDTQHNYSYYPVVMSSEIDLLDAVRALGEHNIFPRRYFYPSLNTLPYLKKTQPCPVSEDISRRVMCLPLYPDLKEQAVRTICHIIAG